IHGHYPEWLPAVGGQPFTFFSPIFNIADAYISVGVIYLLLFHSKHLK
ncbi:MAG: signal peptidase II, partial [Rikenellaceae bacterium]|nr:signal peptidase II [Rikenellaceae bacterium]